MPRTTVHVAAEADCAWHPWLLSAFVDTFGTLHLAAECVPMFCAWLHSHWFRRKRKGRRLAIPAVLITKTCLQLQLWHVYFTLQDWLLCGFCNCATIGTMQVCIKNGDPIMGVLKEGCPRDTADTTSRSFFAHTRVRMHVCQHGFLCLSLLRELWRNAVAISINRKDGETFHWLPEHTY